MSKENEQNPVELHTTIDLVILGLKCDIFYQYFSLDILLTPIAVMGLLFHFITDLAITYFCNENQKVLI